ncbi:DUF86 domain-containing protein [bacterium]|jgi:uncharacterized protein with HEPN domain|nr:DUF86 domain-containing protein [bacterium]|tara:strand:+ start:257 stop:604 length:348 start_codon:yes stop_codon:yes gene_type:complete
MEKGKDKIYCKHILDAIEEIESFTKGMTFKDFEKDKKTQRAVTRDLEIIGEAAKRLSKEQTDKYEQIPWRNIAGMRDFLIHDYMDVDLKEIWKAATEDISELKEVITKMINDINY